MAGSGVVAAPLNVSVVSVGVGGALTVDSSGVGDASTVGSAPTGVDIPTGGASLSVTTSRGVAVGSGAGMGVQVGAAGNSPDGSSPPPHPVSAATSGKAAQHITITNLKVPLLNTITSSFLSSPSCVHPIKRPSWLPPIHHLQPTDDRHNGHQSSQPQHCHTLLYSIRQGVPSHLLQT